MCSNINELSPGGGAVGLQDEVVVQDVVGVVVVKVFVQSGYDVGVHVQTGTWRTQIRGKRRYRVVTEDANDQS